MNLRYLLALCPGVLGLLAAPLAQAQTTAVTWNRQAYGQLMYIPGHEGDPAYSYHYPDNDHWSQQLVLSTAPAYIREPSNWSTPNFPNGDAFDVTLNSTTTDLDRGVGGPISVNSLTIGPSGFFNMEAGTAITIKSFFEIQRDGELTDAGGGGAFPVINLPASATLLKSYGAGTYDLIGNVVLNAAPGAHISSAAGILQLPGNGGLLDGVVFTASSGAIIDLVGLDPSTGADTAKAQHTFTAGAATGTVRLSANSLVGNRDYSLPVDTQTPLVFDFPGTVFQWTGGFLGAYQGQNPMTNMGVMNLAGANSRYLLATLTNSGSIIHTDAGSLEFSIYSSGGILNNAAGGTYEIRGDASINSNGYQPFNNLGLLRKSAGTGTSTLNVIFNNQGGTVQVDSGTLQLGSANGVSTGGVFNVAAGAVFDLGTAGNLTGTYTGAGAGVVRLSGSAYLQGTPTAPGTIFQFTGGGFQWTGGVFGAYQGSNLLTNAGVITMAGSGDRASYAAFTNTGTITHTGTGNFLLGENSSTGSFDNAATGVYELQTDGGIGGGRVFTNEGLLEKTGGAGTSTVDSTFTNTGTVAVSSGTLAFSNFAPANNTLASGAWIVDAGATLNFKAGASVVTNKGDVTLRGLNSTFLALAPLADNQGSFTLGGAREFYTTGALASSGTLGLGAGSTLHVGGALTLSGTSVCKFEVGGAAHAGPNSAGVVQVSGAATLAGNLAVTLAADAILPGADDVITILSAASLTGVFANAPEGARITVSSGASFQINYTTAAVVLEYFSASSGPTPTPAPSPTPTATPVATPTPAPTPSPTPTPAATPSPTPTPTPAPATTPSPTPAPTATPTPPPFVYPPAIVTITVLKSGTVTEGPGKAKALITRVGGDPSVALPVYYLAKGTARNGVDYVELPLIAVIPAGQANIKVKIKPVADQEVEQAETVILKLQESPTGAYTIGKPKKIFSTILDSRP